MEHPAIAGIYNIPKGFEQAVQNFDSVSNIVHNIHAATAESQDTP